MLLIESFAEKYGTPEVKVPEEVQTAKEIMEKLERITYDPEFQAKLREIRCYANTHNKNIIFD